MCVNTLFVGETVGRRESVVTSVRARVA